MERRGFINHTMSHFLRLLCFACVVLAGSGLRAQSRLDSLMPVRGLCIAAPSPEQVPRFVAFIENELAPRRVNTLILRVDYRYEFKSHPELRDSVALSKREVKKLVAACRKHGIRVIPQLNLLGHQSWANRLGNLLRVYPHFDETPHVMMPATYTWPNPDGLYCKSYCPLHPDVHRVVFALVDEITEVFEADAFHAGMDEVFYLGDERCPRCSGRDKAELFAGEVNRIRDHLALTNRQLWIWGDRLIDGKTTGIGLWEGSFNNTHRAIDLVEKDVLICDWHYERPDPTAAYFAAKGFNVVTCPWKNPPVAVAQTQDMVRGRTTAAPPMRERFRGMVQTVWSGVGPFLEEVERMKTSTSPTENSQAACFNALFGEVKRLGAAN